MKTTNFCCFPSSYKINKPIDIPKPPIPKTNDGKSFLSTINQPNIINIKQTEEQKKVKIKNVTRSHSLDIKENTIFDIDRTIKNNFVVDMDNICVFEDELTSLKKLYMMPGCDKVLISDKISYFRKKIKDIETCSSLLLYTFKSQDILDEYKILYLSNSKKSFLTIIDENTNNIAIKLATLYHKYTLIAQLYICIEGITQIPKRMSCSGCNGNNFILSQEDDSIYICKGCFTEKETLDDTPSFKDTDRVNMSSKYTYTLRGHFMDAVKKFQGTQNTDPKKIKYVCTIIHVEMEKHNLVAKQGLKNSVSKDHVYAFLSEQYLSCHYDDINLIFHIITGEACPDISHIIEGLYEDFDKLQEVLTQIKDENRANSLTVNYKLYKLLQRRGFSCRKNYFYILKTKTKEDEHDEKMKEAWDILGWKWIPTF